MAVSPTSSEKLDHPTRSDPPPTRCSPSRSARHEQPEAASDTSSANSGENSGRRDVDILAQLLPSRSEEYRLLFRLPPDEALIQDFNCALQENILLQGHMYLFIHHICFYSNIFGFETKKTIPFHEVTCVRKAKTAAIFHNAIEIVSGEKKHFFGSFLSRDEAFKLIVDGWAQHCSDAKAIVDRQESKTDNNSQDNAGLILEKATGSQRLSDNSSSTDMNKDVINSEECKPLSNIKSNVNESEKLPDQENGEEQKADGGPSSGEPFTWQSEDVDAPKIPQQFTMVTEATFPISVEEFFTLFISDQASNFLENFRRRCGDKEFQYTPWRRHEQFGHARDLSFLHPVKVYIGAKLGRCQEVQKFRVYRNSHLVIETSQQVSDVPYADYFTVEVIWDVETNGNENGCILRIYFSVPFSKRTIFKGKIEQSTREELRDVFAIWINSAHELLKQEKIEKQEGIAEENTSMIQEQEAISESFPRLEGLPRKLLPAVPFMSPQTTSNGENFDLQIDSPVHKFYRYSASGASSFREMWASFASYINSGNQLPLYLAVAVFSILILMQISIIVILIRTPQLHVVTQERRIGSLSSYSSEEMARFEKRADHLKEEMLMLEARMELMHREYMMVKAHMQSLETLKPKS